MDIQSSIFNELFVLYPVIIRGWVTPVKPQGIAQGGIPKVLYDGETQGLECLIDPWTEMQLASWTMAADDRVDLYVNDNPTPATGKTVAPGEEQQRVRLYLPHGWLNQGVNRLYYKVTRVGGNDESSRDTLALYHLRLPESLDLIIPPEVVREGVGPELAARGVTFAFTYTNRRHFDSIVFALGDTTVRFDVPDAPAPINLTLLTDTFQRAGDNPNAVAEFRVFDQLGNAVMSGEKRVDIHLGRLSLLAPTVRGMNGNQFSPTTPEIRVLVPQGSLLPTDTLWVNWQGATAVPEGSYPSPPRLVSAGLEIAVPRSVLAYSLGQRVAVSYFIDRDDKPVESAVLLLDILPLPATALNSPKIVEADANNFLDITALGTKNATIHALLHTLIEAEQPCWLRLEGKKADGTAHDLTLWAGLPARVNSTWINQGFWPQTLANSYLVQLGHGTTLTLKYLVALDKSNIETNAVKFPDRVYTIKSMELVVPTLDRVLDSNGEEVLEGGWTVSTSLTLSGTASKGLDIEVFDDDGSSTVAKGRATADPLTGIWTREVTVAEGKHRLFARSLYHDGDVYSEVRNLTVTTTLEIDPTTMSLDGFQFYLAASPYSAPCDKTAYIHPKAHQTRKAQGGIPPYRYSSSNPNVASVDTTTGQVISIRNGTTEITAHDAHNDHVSYTVSCSNVYELVCNRQKISYAQSLAWMRSIGATLFPAAPHPNEPNPLAQTVSVSFYSDPGDATYHYWCTTMLWDGGNFTTIASINRAGILSSGGYGTTPNILAPSIGYRPRN
ncbi:Ig-like domain-containing protein [Pseudomonas siliginis]|uniref:Ig-like domain-containing protein n=1 Tax=Pseudomonas siliginis TaxID=2842346 RepID=UPI00209257B9|nr:Ig-like domain-containing protein [Pseudomonas siliginis]USU03116.1 Ig-like domain-containing protein [Pseudomonas siliginis]